MKELFIFLAVVYTGAINPDPMVKDYFEPDKIKVVKVADITLDKCLEMSSNYAGFYGIVQCLPQKEKKK